MSFKILRAFLYYLRTVSSIRELTISSDGHTQLLFNVDSFIKLLTVVNIEATVCQPHYIAS